MTLSNVSAIWGFTRAPAISQPKRDFLKNQRQRARNFKRAYCEAIWLAKANRSVVLGSFRKHLREQDPRRLESLYHNYI